MKFPDIKETILFEDYVAEVASTGRRQTIAHYNIAGRERVLTNYIVLSPDACRAELATMRRMSVVSDGEQAGNGCATADQVEHDSTGGVPVVG